MRYTLFPLHPETPEDGISLDELFAGHFDVNAMMKRLHQVAQELELPFGERTHTYNSRNAQELGKWAEEHGLKEAFHDAVYRAYFVEGLNIAQVRILTELAATLGLDKREAETVLEERRYASAVDADWQRVRTMGITAVPTSVYDDKKLVGFTSYNDCRKLITSAL